MQNGPGAGKVVSLDHSLFADRVHKVYEHTPLGVCAALLNAVILVLVLGDQVPLRKLLIWFACVVGMSALRMVLHWRYHHSLTSLSNPLKWYRRFIVSIAMAGILWGSVAVFLFPAGSLGHQAFIAFVEGGMAAGAAGVYSAVNPGFFVFSIPAMLPVGIRFFLLGGHIHMAMGGMVLLFLLVISLVALRTHRDMGNLLALKYERMALVSDLQKEVVRRSEAQEDLRRQKDQVEQIVAQRTAQLRRSEEKFRDLVENINDVLYAVDREGMIAYISPVVESVLGYRTEELTGTSLFDYIYHQDLSPLKNHFVMARKGPGGPGDFRFQGKNGEIKWCRVSCRPIAENQQGGGIQGVLVDISWSKRLEEQLQRAQKMEALGTLAGGVAHDLNNILSGLVSYPDLLLMDLPQDSPLRRPLSTIKKSGENAAAIVQDLLTLARRGVGTLKILGLNKIILECIDSPEIRALMVPSSHIRLTTYLQPGLFNIRGSAIHIFKSLTNLICNAVEAMPGGGSIEIKTENRFVDRPLSGFETIQEGEYVVLSISDTGIGIPESDQARIFEPFYTSKVMGRSGSGLGMAVVWGTIKDHSGYLDFQSREGKGTRFELYFPISREGAEAGPHQEDISELPGNGEFILVVDDMAVQREIATGILSRLGYRVESLASGEEAVEFLRRQAADLVILDMIMSPGMDGYETYHRIKDIRPDQRAIIASGYSESDRVRKALSLGAGRYLKKPYQLTELGAAVREVLEGN
jgi:two-component system, cell cycle sensor histidine kinase and response regulator CckA